MTPGEGTPRSLGYRMPAEWAPHDAIWLSWPHDVVSFGDGLPGAEKAYVELIKAIHKTERVELLVLDAAAKTRVSGLLSKGGVDLRNVRFHVRPYADVWFRDYGPTFVTGPKGLAMVHWIFNAWGDKYEELKADTEIPKDIEALLQVPVFRPGVVMEGGSIDVNGAGIVLTTEQCLLNENRNPKLDRAGIERVLAEHLDIEQVVWLGEGVAGDDTDGHIDDIARFTSEDTVVCAVEERKSDANHGPLKDCFEALENVRTKRGRLNVARLPMPDPVEADGRRLPASYANFYIGNGVVLAPAFGVRQDDEALKALEKLFPGRRIAPVPCRELVAGLGTIHCCSQQQPRA